MADIYKKRIIVPENLPEVLTPPNNNQSIIVEKDLYGTSGFIDNLDTGLKIMKNYFMIYLKKELKKHTVIYWKQVVNI